MAARSRGSRHSAMDERRIWTATLASGVPRDLEGTDDANTPFWSPDGRSIGFFAQGQLRRIEVSTGTISLIAAVPTVSSGATWSAEDIVVFAARYGIFSVPAAGGTPTKVADLNRDKQENQLLFPQFLPDNRHFLYVARSGRPQQSGAYVGSLDGKPIRLFSTTSFVRYAPPGYLLSVRDGALVAQPFNPATFAIGTEATTIVRQIRAQGALNGRFDVSPNGLLAFFAQRTAPERAPALVRSRRQQPWRPHGNRHPTTTSASRQTANAWSSTVVATTTPLAAAACGSTRPTVDHRPASRSEASTNGIRCGHQMRRGWRSCRTATVPATST